MKSTHWNFFKIANQQNGKFKTFLQRHLLSSDLNIGFGWLVFDLLEDLLLLILYIVQVCYRNHMRVKVQCWDPQMTWLITLVQLYLQEFYYGDMECTWTALIIFFYFFLRHLLVFFFQFFLFIQSFHQSKGAGRTIWHCRLPNKCHSKEATTVATKDNISNKKSKGMTTN